MEIAGIVLVLGCIGVALGIAVSELSKLSRDAETATPVADGETTTSVTATTTTARTTMTRAALNPVVFLRVEILDARLFTAGAPSGTQEQPARMTVRIRATNPGSERVTVDPPFLGVGALRIPADPGAERAGSRFDPLPAGTDQTVTLRFALAGGATPKVVRDRRARVLIAGRSLSMRVTVRAPTT